MQRLPLILFVFLLASPALSSPAAAVTAAAQNIDTVSPDDRPHQRYFWEPITGKKEIDEFRVAFKYRALGLLSREPEFVDPVEVPCEGGILFRVDITEVGWDAKVLEQAANLDIYFRDKVKVVGRSPPMRAKGKRPVGKARMAKAVVRVARAPAPWLPVRDIPI